MANNINDNPKIGGGIWDIDYRKTGGVGGEGGGGFFDWMGDKISEAGDYWSNIPTGVKTTGFKDTVGGDGGDGMPGDPLGGGGGGGTPTGAFDSANFNVQDKNQVMELQKQLFPDDPSQWDGVFGPNTQGAYRTMVNQQRTGAGQDPYTYGGPPVNDEQGGLLQTQGVNTQFQRPPNVPVGVDTSQTPFERNQRVQPGQVGGGGFMDKFGTGEGWLSQGAERRAARKLNRQDQYGAAPHNPEFDNIDIDRNTY